MPDADEAHASSSDGFEQIEEDYETGNRNYNKKPQNRSLRIQIKDVIQLFS